MATTNVSEREPGKEHLGMKTPPIVSQQEWEAARQQLLVKEKAVMHARDAMSQVGQARPRDRAHVSGSDYSDSHERSWPNVATNAEYSKPGRMAPVAAPRGSAPLEPEPADATRAATSITM